MQKGPTLLFLCYNVWSLLLSCPPGRPPAAPPHRPLHLPSSIPCPQSFTQAEELRRVFGEYGEVTNCYLPRQAADPSRSKGFAFVQFKHSFAADA